MGLSNIETSHENLSNYGQIHEQGHAIYSIAGSTSRGELPMNLIRSNESHQEIESVLRQRSDMNNNQSQPLNNRDTRTSNFSSNESQRSQLTTYRFNDRTMNRNVPSAGQTGMTLDEFEQQTSIAQQAEEFPLGVCWRCQISPRNCIFLSCGDLLMCFRCGMQYENRACPQCHQIIIQPIRVYVA